MTRTEYIYKPQHFRVLIRQEDLPREHGTSKIIATSDEQHELEQARHTFGTIVAIGSTAFQHTRFGNHCPYKVGDFVYFREYAGDGKRQYIDELGRWSGSRYRTVNDDDILGHAEKTVYQEVAKEGGDA